MAQVKGLSKAPSVAPQGHETAAMLAVLEDSKWTSDKQMAGALVRAAFKLMAERNWWAVANRLDGGPGAPVQLYGFFATEAAALKALETNSLGLIGDCGLFEVHSLLGRTKTIEGWESQVVHGCAECGHTEAGHDWPRAKVRGCVVAGCRCKTYVRPAGDIPAVDPLYEGEVC